jgi:uncharacterized membrane protein YgcG
LISGGKSGSKKEAEQSDPASFLLQKFTPGTDSAEAEVRITLYLKTKRGTPLAPVSISQKIDVRLLSNYPTLKSEPIELSTLESLENPATGSVVFKGPEKSDGKVCIDTNVKPVVIKDKVSRADTYKVTTAGVDAEGCMPIRQGEEGTLKLTVSNSVTASSDVILGLPITYYSDAEPGKHFTLNAQVNFKSDPAGDPLLWVVILTILGIGLPLALIYLLLWWATRIAYGRQLQRAEYPVAITTEGRITNRDGGAIATHGENYQGRPQQADVRVLQDGSATLSAKLPKTVLAEPWYEIKAPEGSRVISVGNIAPRVKNKKRFATGKVAPIVGDLGKIWYILISDSALLKAEKGSLIEAKLVIFNRRDLTNLNQHRDSLNKVSSKPGLGKDVEQLISAVKAEKPKNDGKGGGGGNGGGGNGGGGNGGGPGGRTIPGGSPGRTVGAGAPTATTRPNLAGAPSRSVGPSTSPASNPSGPTRATPPTTPGGSPARPSAPGAPPRRGGTGAPT